MVYDWLFVTVVVCYHGDVYLWVLSYLVYCGSVSIGDDVMMGSGDAILYWL